MGVGIEGSDLRERILAVRAVHHENHFVRGAFERLFLRAADAREFIHKMELRGKTSGRIGDHDVHAAGAPGVDGIEHHCSGVAARLRDDFNAVALAPDGELLASRGAERIARGEKHGVTGVGKAFGELANACRLARAVDAAHHDDAGLGLVDVERAFGGLEDFDQLIAQRELHLVLSL